MNDKVVFEDEDEEEVDDGDNSNDEVEYPTHIETLDFG